MKLCEKKALFEQLYRKEFYQAETVHDILEKSDSLKINYHEYMTTAPIECDEELRRLSSADYDLCCALLTMLLREDHFSNGSFERRQRSGQIRPIIYRILQLLSQDD